MEIKRGRGYVHSIQYHIVWCIKYKKNLLKGEVDSRLKEIMQEQAVTHKFEIIEMETVLNHIHMLVDCYPQHTIPNLLKALKENSARFLFKEFPELKSELWSGSLWNPSYFICTVSDRTAEQIRAYIKAQPTKKREHGRPFSNSES